MASRLAMLALLLVFAVWGAWPNYVATVRVKGEAGKQILLAIFHFRAFLANISYINFSFASLAELRRCLQLFQLLYTQKTLKGRNSWKL